MFHFFSKLGRRPWTKNVVPAAAFAASTSYICIHYVGHNFIRNLISAQKPSGEREEITPKLQKLILQVWKEIGDCFNVQPIEIPGAFVAEPELKWFATSNMDPVNFGSSDTTNGILIGLPNYYNYDEENELPSNLFRIRSFKFFKSSKGSKKDESTPDEQFETDEDRSLNLIDINSEDGKSYKSSLILSENAKKFSIARELFFADSYRITIITGAIFISALLPVYLSRAMVQYMKLADAHLSQRLSVYSISALAGWGNYTLLADSVNEFYCYKADTRASQLNESYRKGALEYFAKMIQRNKALRNMIDDMKYVYDEDGNHIEPILEPLFRRKHVPATLRLAKVQASELDQS